MLELEQLVTDFAKCIELADAKQPLAKNSRTKEFYLPGFRPNQESQAVSLVADEFSKANFIGRRNEAHFANLVHPYHQFGAVYGWEVGRYN